MAKNPTPQQWAASLLDRLGIRQTPGAVQAITGWERAEGGHWNNQARFNPLNTTQSAPGAGNTGSQGNIKVYRDWNQGLDATVKTLRNGRYGGILSALEAGDPSAVANAIGQTPWGTGGDLVKRTIMGTPRVSGVQGFDAGGSQPQASADPAPSAPGAPSLLDAGQGSDFTSLLGSLLAKPQPAQASPSPIQAPAFAAGPKLPQGAQLLSPAAPPQNGPDASGGLSDALSLVAALGGSNPTVGSSGGSQTADGVSGGRQQPAAAGSSSPAGSGRFPTGVTGKVIGTPYSGTHTLGNWQSDNAVDIAVPEGTPMIALQDGVVLKVRHHPQDGGRFAGDQITIRGANGNEYFYAHGVADVKPGQKITKGESLGATGSANGVAHLHFGQMRGDPRKHTR